MPSLKGELKWMTMKKNTADCCRRIKMWREMIAEFKCGPSVFLHGPEFWLVFPWVCGMILTIALFGGKRK